MSEKRTVVKNILIKYLSPDLEELRKGLKIRSIANIEDIIECMISSCVEQIEFIMFLESILEVIENGDDECGSPTIQDLLETDDTISNMDTLTSDASHYTGDESSLNFTSFEARLAPFSKNLFPTSTPIPDGITICETPNESAMSILSARSVYRSCME
ncbi:unnamed protein product [Allacma fusca]|uniref:Uncharacterized protein n=1 Tax=Allacma fusca TaxID=39272 RepID=A0A8J2LPH7_9HEXA|nr:unnamed protein product [Allacma fusca]